MLNTISCRMLILFAAIICLHVQAQIPSTFLPRGTGGGGAFFSPSISPADADEFYVASDMSGVYHTTDFGLSYETVDFRNLQGGHSSRIAFTSNAAFRYTIDYTNDQGKPVKSVNFGQTWQLLPGNPDPGEETYSIHADYSSSNRVVISYYDRIYLSNDGGNTFSLVHTALNSNSGVVLGGAFFDGQNIYLGTNDGLLVSADGGISFTTDASTGIQPGQKIFSFAGAKAGTTTRFFVLTADALDIYVGTMGWDYWGFIRGVYSLDYGSGAWVNRLPGIVTAQDYLMYVAMANNDTGTAYLAGSTNLGQPNVMRWRGSTNQWQHVFQTQVNQNIYTGWSGAGGDQSWTFPECIFGIAVAPLNSSKVIVTDYSCVHKTSDGGVTWQQAYVSAADQHPAGTNTPENQNYHSAGIENTSCWQVFWLNPSDLLAACSDVTAMRSSDGGASWSFNFSGMNDNTVYRIARNISNTTLYAATSSIHDMYQSTRLQDVILDAANATGKILYSSDNGSTWLTLHDFGHPVYWVATDPNNANRLYASVVNHSASQGGIWVSNNINLGASCSWTRITTPGRTEGHPGNIQVLSDGTVLCSFNGRRNAAGAFTQSSGVFIYNPGLQQWSDKSDSRMFYWTQDVVVDPNDPLQNTWYAGVYNGWGGPPNGLGGLYKTTDRGNSWTRLSTMEGVTSVTFNPAVPNQLFIASSRDGLLSSQDINSAAPTFQQVSGYPFRQPHRIFFNPYNSSEIWVSSFGNGMRVGDMGMTGVTFSGSKPGRLKLHPNPASKTMILDAGAEGPAQVEIRNMLGEVVRRDLFPDRQRGKLSIDISSLESGVYLVAVITPETSGCEKLIVR